MIIEIILLSILLPFLWDMYSLFKTRKIRFLASFEVLRLYVKIADALADLIFGDGKIRMGILLDAMAKGEIKSIKSSYYYSSLMNDLYLLDKKIDCDGIISAIDQAPLDKIKQTSNCLNECLDEINKLVMMHSFSPMTQEELYKLRGLFSPLRDMFAALVDGDGKLGSLGFPNTPRRVAEGLHELGDILEKLSRNNRERIDKWITWNERRKIIYMLFHHRMKIMKALYEGILKKLNKKVGI